jgi:NAD(P)-dependent dehydrogenase (short-subunit alcohol dehydrogenase family)
MRTILISGAANGLGAAFLEVYASQIDTNIIAIDRIPISTRYSNAESFSVDVTDEGSINSFQRSIAERTIDLLVHSAGVRGLVPAIENEKPDDVAACETMDVMDTATLTRAFQINTIGTFNLIRAILPNLRRAHDPKVVTMSSRMGSLGNNETGIRAAGSAYAYRASKAAQNAVVRSFVVDVPEVTFVMCHPGRVETKLVRCVEEGAITAEKSVKAMLPLIEGWSRKDSGKFFDRFGEVIQW